MPVLSCFTVLSLYFAQCSLWSNEFDLSLQAGDTAVDAHTGVDQLHSDIHTKTATQMVVNDLATITSQWPSSSAFPQGRVVAIVMDNTSPEMFADLVLGEFLLTAGFAERVIYMPKTIPWFVSDVTQRDFDWLLKEALPANGMTSWAEKWQSRFADGSFAVELYDFWIMPFGYSEMQLRAPELYRKLTKECSVVIFKVSAPPFSLVEKVS